MLLVRIDICKQLSIPPQTEGEQQYVSMVEQIPPVGGFETGNAYVEIYHDAWYDRLGISHS
jgi:hypothetical protein